MVDFNNETITGRPAADIERLSWLQSRAYFLDAVEDYYKRLYQGADIGPHIIKARLFTLYNYMHSTIKRRFKEKEAAELLHLINSSNVNDLMKAFYVLSDEMDKMRLIVIDTKTTYNRMIVEEENEAHGV